MTKGALISLDRNYRYSLWRIWDFDMPLIMFIGLNPSTAGIVNDDPTIRRLIEYTKAWGFGGFFIGNIFAYRTSDPRLLRETKKPVGSDNTKHLKVMASVCDKIIFMWGNGGTYKNKHLKVIKKFQGRGYCFKITNAGNPYHPLYLSKEFKPIKFRQ